PPNEAMLISKLVKVMASPSVSGVCNVVPKSMTTLEPSVCVKDFASKVTPSLRTKEPEPIFTGCLKYDFKLSASVFSSSDNFSPEKTILPV
ncbi:polymorphic membrane B domain protein, partial [Chlamydia psittaci 09DC77]